MTKKRKLRPIVKFLFTIIVLAVVSFISVPKIIDILSNGKGIEFIGKDINLLTTETPSYVDKQLIHKGKARSGRKLKSVENIVVHYTANPGTSAQNNRDYFDKEDTEVCSHFVIGIDGEIIQCLPIDEKSAASNERNIDTISIEVCHENEDGKFSEKAMESLTKLTAWLCNNSGLEGKDVIRHYDITGKICPKYFVDNPTAFKEFKNSVDEELKEYK